MANPKKENIFSQGNNYAKIIFLYRKQIIILSFFILLSSVFFLLAPYISQLFIDKAFLNKDLTKFLQLSFFGGAVFIISALVKVFEDVLKNRISVKLKLSLSGKFMRKFYAQDLGFFQFKSAGESAFRLSDIDAVANFVLEQTPAAIAEAIKLLVILGVSLWISLPMTVCLLVLSPLFLIHSYYLQKKLKPIYEEIWKYSSRLYKEIYEAFSKNLIIKAFGLESFQRHVYLRALIKNTRWAVRSFRWSILNSVSASFLSKAVYGLITLYGGWLIIKGRITLGSYTAAMLYLTQLGGILQSFSSRFGYFTREAVSINRFFEIMDSQPQIQDSLQAAFLNSLKGDIRFENVNFGYEKDKAILKDINFSIPAGGWVGMVGQSGCGKTTLANLILRLYDPWQGKIILCGIDLKGIKLRSLRIHSAIATQAPLLFDLSVRENISYGLKSLTQEEIEEAAKISCAHDFIVQLSKGYDTVIGEDACRLSQGLKQRIALARAIVRKPDLLILDEASSSIDSLTEEKIFKALRQKRQGLTTIIISHRLFCVKDADRIYFLREGGIIEEGRQEELLAKSLPYRKFLRNQIDNDFVGMMESEGA